MSNSTQHEVRFPVTAVSAIPFIERILQAGRVPMLHSSPGVGKSSLYAHVAKEFNLLLIDIRLSMCDPTDMNGFAAIVDGKATYIPFDMFPVVGTKVPDGYSGWMILLDEFNSAPRSVEAAAYKILLDRMIGMKPLHENAVVAAAGNLTTDRAIVNAQSSASKSRMIHLELVAVYDAWLQKVGIPFKYDPRIIAFLSNYENQLMDFDPTSKDFTYSCPRTIEFLNDLIYPNQRQLPVPESDMPLIAGTIGKKAARLFRTFVEVYNELVSIQDILDNPLTCSIPDTVSARWATIARSVSSMKIEDAEKHLKYLNRFDLQFRILALRMVMAKGPEFTNLPPVNDMCVELADYLFS